MDMIDFTDANCLIDAYRRTQKVSGWKESNQRFGLCLLRNTRKLQKEIRSGTYEQSVGSIFTHNENGKVRLVKALTVRDMVVQHALCDNVLIPELSKKIIHDNGASLKNKGISFTRRRFEQHLREHYRKYGTKGYILKIDFRKYFDNIVHEYVRESVFPIINKYSYVIDTINKILKANRIDVSYSDDKDIIHKIFNALEYQKISRGKLTGARFMDKSLGIGSPSSQIIGIFLPTLIDTWCKIVRGIRHYDVYMDDRIVIHHDKQFLFTILEEIKTIARELGIHVNQNKTQVIKISHGFTFLKTKYYLTDSGKIIRRMPQDVIVRERRKLKKLHDFVKQGELTPKQFNEQYSGWRGDKRRYNSHTILMNMDNLYGRLKNDE